MRIITARDRFVAEVTSRDDECLVAERDGHAIDHALTTHSVVIIRGMELVPAEQVALTRLLGEPEVVTDMRNHHPESVDILVVSNSGSTRWSETSAGIQTAHSSPNLPAIRFCVLM